MNINVQQTPNPDTLKFVLDVELVKNGTIEFKSASEGNNYPFVGSFFNTCDIELLFLGSNFISVKKKPTVNWNEMQDSIENLIRLNFSRNFKPIEIAINIDSKQSDIFKRIEEVLELKIRPAVAMDGGNIKLKAFVDGVAEVELQGSCAGCPSSTLTLKQGVERMLVHYVPEVKSVRAISH